jgi:hypothetical protein
MRDLPLSSLTVASAIRSYEEPANQAFVNDILDGYFPIEFKESFPDGVRVGVCACVCVCVHVCACVWMCVCRACASAVWSSPDGLVLRCLSQVILDFTDKSTEAYSADSFQAFAGKVGLAAAS